ncbi:MULTISPECIES: hypothetical protein [Pseudomonas]|uniref:Uncharacterized protein n=1 Tax=Pseudomonas fluorescens TaxID=294 RepID=A0A5E6SAC9_PSEFL|nr:MULTISPECIES: hypothetical protein [Pseudomonas]VVM74295.1 hypothetical protein PS652_01939 [Pseudomonas fluorescens]
MNQVFADADSCITDSTDALRARVGKELPSLERNPMPSVFSQITSQPPKSQIKIYCMLVVVTSLFAVLSMSSIQGYTTPNPLQMQGLEGRLTGWSEVWNYDQSLMRMGVRFRLPGEREDQRRTVYVPKDILQSSQLSEKANVALLVERISEDVIVREMHSLDGRLLFDDSLLKHVVSVGDERAQRGLVVSVLMAVLSLLAAVVTWWRHLRAPTDHATTH